jgi:hypothetical protein
MTVPATQPVESGALILHFDGSRWTRVPTPSRFPIAAITMDAPGDGWALADTTILHYTGGAWQLFPTAAVTFGTGASLYHISMSSPDDGWIAGSQESSAQGGATSFLLHFQNGQWLPYQGGILNSIGYLNDLSMRSPNDGWATASTYTADSETGVVLHYQDGSWTAVGSGFPGATLSSVAAAGPNEAWAVGIGGPSAGIIVHCLDGVCQQVPSPTPNILSVITSRSTSEGWIGGDGAVIFRRDGSQWTQRSPTYHQVSLTGLLAFSDRDGWAIGQSSGVSLPPGAVMFHCVNGVWQVYQLHVRVSG